MNKNRVIIILKSIVVAIVLIYLWVIYDADLYKGAYNDFDYVFEVFLPILVLGFTGIIYGIIALLKK